LFDFLGLAKCGECSGAITAEKHTKLYKRTDRTVEYTYYRCSKIKTNTCKNILIKSKLRSNLGKLFCEHPCRRTPPKSFLSGRIRTQTKRKKNHRVLFLSISTNSRKLKKKQIVCLRDT
jgi:hypothetical protein